MAANPSARDQLLISSLPHELLRIILSYSSDFPTLLSTIASCQSLYGAFHSFPGPLISAVLERDFGPSIYSDAVRRMKAYNFRQGIVDGKTLQTARGEFIRRNLGSTHSWTLSEGVGAVRLDNVMRKLSQSIADELLANLEDHVLKGQDTPIAQTELCRIRKSLYRMETFCDVFPGLPHRVSFDIYDLEDWIAFFGNYSSWEIEQLGSIHESLFRLTAPSKYYIPTLAIGKGLGGNG